jgi:hypothetical protein
MKYNQPSDQPSNPNAPYIDGNPTAGIQGSIVPAAAVEYPQREIVGFVNDCGLVPANNDLAQLRKGVQVADVYNHFKLSQNFGSASQWSAQVPALPVMPPPAGTAIWFKPGFDSVKGGALFSVNGSTLMPVYQSDSYTPIDIGDVTHTQWLLLMFDGTVWLIVSGGIARGGAMPLLQTNANWYVDTVIGDDNLLDGTSPTISTGGGASHGPFRTIQRAINETYKYNMNGYSQFINIADGTYNETPVGVTTNGVGNVYIRGSSGNPQACTIAKGIFFTGGYWVIGNLRVVQPGPSSPDCIMINGAGCTVIVYGTVYFGSTYRYHLLSSWSSHLNIAAGSNIICEAGITCQGHAGNSFNAPINVPNPPGPNGYPSLTLNGTMTMSQAFLATSDGASSFILYRWINGKANAVGSKYVAAMNGTINTGPSGDQNYYPGTTPGSIATGGQYA